MTEKGKGMTDKRRIAYLDIARGIGMILVVVGHVEYVDSTLRLFIAAFHMPLFFLISGILIWEKQEEEGKFIELVKRKLRSIMLPYVVFSLLSFAIEGGRIAIKGLDQWEVVFRQLFQSLCLQGVSTLWFLPALFMSELFFVLIRKKFKNSWTIGIISAIVIIVAFLNTAEQNIYRLHGESLAWGLLHDVVSMLLRNLFCAGLVGAGYYMGRYLLPRLTKLWQVLAGLLASGIAAWVVIPMNLGVDLRYMQLGNLSLFWLGAVGGALAVLFLSRLLEAVPVSAVKLPLEYFGRSSLIIMVTHMDFRVLYCSIRVAGLLQQLWNNQAVFCVCIVVLVFLIEIPVIWFVNRYLPMIMGKKYKSS